MQELDTFRWRTQRTLHFRPALTCMEMWSDHPRSLHALTQAVVRPSHHGRPMPQTRALHPRHAPCNPLTRPGPSDMCHSFSMCRHPPGHSDPPGPSSQHLRCDSCMPRPVPAVPLCRCACHVRTALTALTLQAPGPFCTRLAPSTRRARAPRPSSCTPTRTHASRAIHAAPAPCPGHTSPSMHVPRSCPRPSLARCDIASEVPG